MRPEERLANPLRSQRIGVRRAVTGRQMRLRVTRSGLLGTRVVKLDVPVVDVSVSGIGILVPDKIGLGAGRVVSIEIEGVLGRAKVAVVREAEARGKALCGLNFLDPNPKFLPAVLSWLGEEEARQAEEPRIEAGA